MLQCRLYPSYSYVSDSNVFPNALFVLLVRSVTYIINIPFVLVSRDLNKGKTVRVGESIHKFCCYSFPLCPSEFFHNLNFPPSAKGVVGHFYKEINSYDFAKGRKKPDVYKDQEIRHFTNIVWRKSSEVGCAQSKRNKKGCVYTVIRYKTEGSIGAEEDFKANVHPIGMKHIFYVDD